MASVRCQTTRGLVLLEAEPLYKRALKMLEKTVRPNYPLVATVCEKMAELYKKIGKEDQAERLEARARRIRLNQ
jgi:lipopolysaccharide biosynthesis regulator YciM